MTEKKKLSGKKVNAMLRGPAAVKIEEERLVKLAIKKERGIIMRRNEAANKQMQDILAPKKRQDIKISLPANPTKRQRELHKQLLALTAEYNDPNKKKEEPKKDIYSADLYDQAPKAAKQSTSEDESVSNDTVIDGLSQDRAVEKAKKDVKRTESAIDSDIMSRLEGMNKAEKIQLLTILGFKNPEEIGLAANATITDRTEDTSINKPDHAIHEPDHVMCQTGESETIELESSAHDPLAANAIIDSTIEESGETKEANLEESFELFKVGIFKEARFPQKTTPAAFTPIQLYECLIEYSSNTDAIDTVLKRNLKCSYFTYLAKYELRYGEVRLLREFGEKIRALAFSKASTELHLQPFSALPNLAFKGEYKLDKDPESQEMLGELSQSYIKYMKDRHDVLQNQAKILERGTYNEKLAEVNIQNNQTSVIVEDITVEKLADLNPLEWERKN